MDLNVQKAAKIGDKMTRYGIEMDSTGMKILSPLWIHPSFTPNNTLKLPT